jgi:hypothetical protein
MVTPRRPARDAGCPPPFLILYRKFGEIFLTLSITAGGVA